eukprot:TRINITY_DN81040_c0_g1_i1.p1 TRINITY_DN81040_c0_g1~~TRINITY_DN81040_c0_g1_i1.p1  ORF type:complete len:583 (-),score=95.16 TRINITY_DN81040_c0_g1_i1:65-1813(-)
MEDSLLSSPVEGGRSTHRKSEADTLGRTLAIISTLLLLVLVIFSIIVVHRLGNIHSNAKDAKSNSETAKDTISTVSKEQQAMETSVNSISSDQQSLHTSLSAANKFLPSKFRVDLITPVKDQEFRGTCWDFSTIGTLEARYMQQGVDQGFLEKNAYRTFSEQGYGISVVNYCHKYPYRCPDTSETSNSTQGGYPSWLYFFSTLKDEVVANTACPYIATESAKNDNTCPDYAHKRDTTPIHFTVQNYVAMYDIDTIKRRLLDKNRVMPITTMIFSSKGIVPCTAFYSGEDDCVNKTLPCPNSSFGEYKYCHMLELGMNAFTGTFYRDEITTIEGGHAMEIVGWNDIFKPLVNVGWADGGGKYIHPDKPQVQGGFIVKNSWGPTGYSLEYLMQDTGYDVEHADDMCGDATLNPLNWEFCDQRCLTNATYCNSNNGTWLWDKGMNSTTWEVEYCIYGVEPTYGGSNKISMLAHTRDTNVYTNYVVDAFPYPFLPILYSTRDGGSDVKHGNKDHCGYYFLPYDYFLASQSTYTAYVIDYDINFSESSFLKNKDKYPQYDYTWLEQSGGVKPDFKYISPYPFLQDVV